MSDFPVQLQTVLKIVVCFEGSFEDWERQWLQSIATKLYVTYNPKLCGALVEHGRDVQATCLFCTKWDFGAAMKAMPDCRTIFQPRAGVLSLPNGGSKNFKYMFITYCAPHGRFAKDLQVLLVNPQDGIVPGSEGGSLRESS